MKILSSLLVALLSAASVFGKDLGTVGATYDIAERDALQEIEERTKEIDWSKVFDKKVISDRIRNYRPKGMEALPAAARDRLFSVDMTYTLDFDVPDGKGGIIYPRGYRFNPLDYVFLPNILVVIDGGDERQVEWFRNSPYAKDIRSMLLLTAGSYRELSTKLKRPVFYADAKLTSKFSLKAVPSVIVQKGNVMEVQEYALREDKGKKSK